MKKLKSITFYLLSALFIVSCSNDDDNQNIPNAGVLSGGPFSFTIDGMPDMVSGVTLNTSNLSGDFQTFVITDANKNILGLPPTLAALEGVDFDGAGEGSCYIYHISYNAGLTSLVAGTNLDNLAGTFNLSNFLTVNRNSLNAGVLSGGPYNFTVGDGIPDLATNLMLDASQLNGTNQSFIVTDADLNILGLPPTIEAARTVNFDGAPVGVCLIWHITYENGITGLTMGSNANNLDGFFALSNSITVNRSN